MTKFIFSLHRDIMADYKLYIDSFINIADNNILNKVNEKLESGSLFPDPLVQLNPTFESGGTVNDLVKSNHLVPDFNNIFYDNTGKSWSIYKHQSNAISIGNSGKGFVVTSGTGSGKSLTYISTIFNHLFMHRGKPGIKAIIVYPLNALINSQEAALNSFNENYKKRTGNSLPFTNAKHKGKKKQDDRDRVRYTISPAARKEVLKRLLELNHKLHAEEVAAGLWDKKKGGAAKKTARENIETPPTHVQEELF